MIGTKPQTAKPSSKAKTKLASKLLVGFDVFGNAVPDVPSAQVEGTGKAMRVVKKKEVTLKPSRKTKAKQGALVVVKPSFLGRLIPWGNQAGTVTKLQPAAHDGVAERLEYAFKRLHHEFNEREQQLETRLQELKQHHQLVLQAKQKQRRWIIPAVVAGAVGGGYMLYVLTSMQGSMTNMSGNITAMNGHMGSMAGDTQVMSQNIQTMNGSMANLNGNVAYMNGNVAQMTQQIGTISQAAAPMGQAAQTMSPFMKMFRSFSPF